MRAAPGAIAVGRAARAEDERRGRGLGGEAGTVREDEQAAVEALPKFHATARVGARRGSCTQRGPRRTVLSWATRRVYRQLSPAARSRGARRSAPRGSGGGPREARVEVSEEGGEKGIGRLERGNAAQTQLAHEAVLQGLPEALDAALGLGGMRGDAPSAGRPGALPFGSS